MNNDDFIERYFDEILFQTSRGMTHEQLDAGRRIDSFKQVKEWKSNYGYKFSIYSNDHLINGKKHFHFDNDAKDIHCKVDFSGEVLGCDGKNSIPANILKDLLYFLSKPHVSIRLNEMWDKQNPTKAW